MSDNNNLFQNVISHAKEYGYIFPSSEVYDGLSAVYDYGSYGVELKKNIKELWWKNMVQLNENIVGVDAAILMHPTTWKASGHVDSFADPLVDNKDSKKRYRFDHLIEGYASKLEAKGKKEEAKEVLAELEQLEAKENLVGMSNMLQKRKIPCPVSGTTNWTEVRQFNLMFSTQLGNTNDATNTLYLRPETAQGIFVNFLNVQKTTRQKIPFGIAQIGKAFRNEIVARQFIFRMREFEQMEMQFFIRPNTQKEWFEHWKEKRLQWHKALGIPPEALRYHDHIKLAHYADAATDIEFKFPFGYKEVEGIHSRTDFDLGNHQKYSKKKVQYFDPEMNESYVPYVIETSIGLDRTVLMVLCNALREEELINNDKKDTRTLLQIPKLLTPIKASIMPLTKKDGLPEIGRKLFTDLSKDLMCQYDEKDSIGKRYRRQDAIGTAYCITVDYESKEDNSVTIRDRDSMKQERIPLNHVKTYLREHEISI